MRLGNGHVYQLINSSWVTCRIVCGIGLAPARDGDSISDAGGSVCSDDDRESDGRIAGAGRERIAASASERAQHAGPACAADVSGCQTGRQSVGDSYHTAGSCEAGVSGGDGVSGPDLSLTEVANV